MYNAKGLINIALEAKTTWNAQDLVNILQHTYCTAQFSTPTMQKAFAVICDNFKIHITEHNITAMGRNQFKKWFDLEYSGLTRAVKPLSVGAPGLRTTRKPVVTVHNTFTDAENYGEVKIGEPEPCMLGGKLPPLTEQEEIIKLRRENAELKGSLEALKMQYEKMEPILNAFTAVLRGDNFR